MNETHTRKSQNSDDELQAEYRFNYQKPTSNAKGLAASFRLKTQSLESDRISSCFHESPIGKLI